MTGRWYSIYNPAITTYAVVDTVDPATGVQYVANTSMASYGGKFWAIMDGSATGYEEGAADQKIWMTTSIDGLTWVPPFTPFRSSTYCNNPVTGTVQEWQPNLVAVGGELWALWSGAYGYCSKLTSATGKWTNYRFEFIGEKPYLSTTITGSATSGRTLYPAVDGITDWITYPSGDPKILRSTGAVLCPANIYSFGSAPGFTAKVKYNVLLTTSDGTDWGMVRIPTTFPKNVAWEPFIVENAAGHVYVYSRNLNTTGGQDAVLVAVSYDGGVSFTPSVSSRLAVTGSRGGSVPLPDGRTVILHTDNLARRNGTVFIAGRNSDDYIPGPNFSEYDTFKYPQGITVGDELWINSSSGGSRPSAAADTDGMGRQSYRLTKVALPDPDTAVICPRKNVIWDSVTNTSVSDPELVAGTLPYYKFNGDNRMVSQASVTTAGSLTYAAWVNCPYDMTLAPLMDNRSGSGGALFRMTGMSLGSTNIYSGLTAPLAAPVFVASVIDNTGTVKSYMASGGGSFATKTSYFKSVLFSGQPSDGETITVDGTVYTFKTSASLAAHVQIGATSADTASTLKSKIVTQMGTGNAASTFILNTRLLISKPSGASFTVSTTSSNISVEATIDLSGGVGYVGTALPGSSVGRFHGKMYGLQVYASALSDNNIRYLYNNRCAEFSYATISGTQTAPSAALLALDPKIPNAVQWASVGQAHRCQVVDENTLRVLGEASASVELPYGATQVGIRWKLSNTPVSSDKYVIATFGLPDNPVRLYINAADPNGLYLDGTLVMYVPSPTDWNVVAVVTSPGKVKVGNVQKYVPGAARCFLGNAYPEGLLASTKSIDFDVSSMKASIA